MSDEGPVSAAEPDWEREKCRRPWDPGRKLVKAIRGYQRWRGVGGAAAQVMCRCHVFRHRFWSVVTGADVPVNTKLGGGFQIPHPNGVVIHPDATIGPNCRVFQQVTIGMVNPTSGCPTIGGHVEIGAGAKVLGKVQVGDHAVVGANAVVLCDVPAHAVAVGVPARIISARDQRSAEETRDTVA